MRRLLHFVEDESPAEIRLLAAAILAGVFGAGIYVGALL
jgi:hypothetical protein